MVAGVVLSAAFDELRSTHAGTCCRALSKRFWYSQGRRRAGVIGPDLRHFW